MGMRTGQDLTRETGKKVLCPLGPYLGQRTLSGMNPNVSQSATTEVHCLKNDILTMHVTIKILNEY